MNTVEDVCKYIGSVVNQGVVCIETGCTFSLPHENEEHTTTNNIAKYICLPNSGILYSLDIDASHIECSKKVIPTEPSNLVEFILGDSVESMCVLRDRFGATPVVDVLCLDALGDPEHTAQEYLEIKSCLKDKHFVLVDDIHNPNSIKYKTIVPLLKSLGYTYKEIFTPTGLFLSCVGYDLEG